VSGVLESYFGWVKKDEEITVIDAREDNFIKTIEGVVPIDLVISKEPQSKPICNLTAHDPMEVSSK
jgi:hypothetical protein